MLLTLDVDQEGVVRLSLVVASLTHVSACVGPFDARDVQDRTVRLKVGHAQFAFLCLLGGGQLLSASVPRVGDGIRVATGREIQVF